MINKIHNSILFRLKYFFKHIYRKKQLSNTVASNLTIAEIDSLELLKICENTGYEIKCIYDIGANVGIWAVLAKGIFNRSTIECFEPMGLHEKEFKKNTKNIPNINFHLTALGSQDSFEKIYIASQSDSSSLLELTQNQTDIYSIKLKEESIVKMVSLDDYIIANNLAQPDLMKLDIQGYELEALKGAKEAIRLCKFVILEVSFIEFYKGQPLFEEVITFMFEYNFRVIAFGYNTETGVKLSQTDVLFQNMNVC